MCYLKKNRTRFCFGSYFFDRKYNVFNTFFRSNEHTQSKNLNNGSLNTLDTVQWTVFVLFFGYDF